MGNKSRARKKKAATRSRVTRAALREAEEKERARVEKVARKERRRAAKVVANAFVKQFMPRPERIDTFREAMCEEMVIEFTKRYKTTREEEALWWMSYDCRLCGIGKWYCQCGPNSFLDMNSDGEHATDGEGEWEPDLGWLEEDEKQNEGLQTPNKGERSTFAICQS